MKELLMLTVSIALLTSNSLGWAQTKTATIKKKDGSQVVGEIRSNVILKGKDVKETKTDSGIQYIVSYTLLNGDWIWAIDSVGVHSGNTFALLTASRKGKPPDDNEVIQWAVERLKSGGSGLLMAQSLPSGGRVLIVSDQSAVPRITKGMLLGQFREEQGKSKIFPSIEIFTSKGVTKVAVSEIVEFKN